MLITKPIEMDLLIRKYEIFMPNARNREKMLGDSILTEYISKLRHAFQYPKIEHILLR